MPRLQPAAILAFLFVATLGCGGGASPDRGVENGSGVVDPTVETPVDAMDPAADWPEWRGAHGDNVAVEQSLPEKFGEETNVVWKVKIPGRGHGSATVVGDRVYLATADEAKQTQSVLALERETGKQVWIEELHSGGFPTDMHAKSSHASCTVACDGERLFVAFVNHDKVHVTALDLDGEVLWQEVAGDFSSRFGYAPSPTIYKSSVVVAADHDEGGHVTSWDRESGALNWKVNRPEVSTYASPVVHTIGLVDQLLLPGARRIACYDPESGAERWSAEGLASACVGTIVEHDGVVFGSGGYPEREIMAVDGTSGDVLWRKRDKSYVPSLLAHEGHVFMVDDKGTARCYDAKTGDVSWQERLEQQGDFSASPLLADGRLFTISEGGDLCVLAVNPDEFELLQKVRIEDEAFASPVACGNRLYLRVASKDGPRQEWLYCFGE